MLQPLILGNNKLFSDIEECLHLIVVLCAFGGVEEVNFKYYENENSAALKLKGCDTCLFSELLFKEVSVRFSLCPFKDTNELYLHMIACRERAKPERET